MYLDGMDSYSILINDTEFTDNKCRVYGDNVFARQTRLELGEPQPPAVVEGRRRLQASEPPAERIINITFSNFSTPNSNNQLYFENIQELNLVNDTFFENEDSLAVEGGSIFSKNGFNIAIVNSTFKNQSSLIRGGAFYLAQANQTYFGKSFSTSLTQFAGNTFESCISQQGGCIYNSYVQNMQVAESNLFINSLALLYYQEFQVAIQHDQEHQKHFERLAAPSKMGKGPVIYFDCDEVKNCSLVIMHGTFFNDSRILDVDTQQFLKDSNNGFTNIKSLYYTVVPPQIPAYMQTQVEQAFFLVHSGTQLLMMTNTTETSFYLELAQKQMANHALIDYRLQDYLDISNQTLFAAHYNFTSFVSGQSALFGDLPLAIVNDVQVIQTYDQYSNLSLSISTTETNSIHPMLSAIVDGTEIKHEVLNFTSMPAGYFMLPPVVVHAMPGSNVTLLLQLYFNHTDALQLVMSNISYQLTLAQCAVDEIINHQGDCQRCDGPDRYILEPINSQPVNGTLQIQECSACEKSVFSCFGNENIKANTGYQLVNQGTATFIACDQMFNNHLCLANNTCKYGYQGLGCKQCVPYFFRDFDGSCQECPKSIAGTTTTYTDSTFIVFQMLFNWLLLVVVILFVKDMELSGEKQNKLSSVTFLFKNIVNYVIYFVLLSELFATFWMNEEMPANVPFQHFVKFMRLLYRVPINTVDYQCYQDQGASVQPDPTPVPQDVTLLAGTWPDEIAENEHRRYVATIILASLISFILLVKALLYILSGGDEEPVEDRRHAAEDTHQPSIVPLE